jgi:hypothetical protein
MRVNVLKMEVYSSEGPMTRSECAEVIRHSDNKFTATYNVEYMRMDGESYSEENHEKTFSSSGQAITWVSRFFSE